MFETPADFGVASALISTVGIVSCMLKFDFAKSLSKTLKSNLVIPSKCQPCEELANRSPAIDPSF